MKYIKALLVILICTICFDVQQLFGNDMFNRLTVETGLAHTDANCLAQDSTGLIWIGTYAGLQSYDGYTLHTYDYYSDSSPIYQSHNRIKAMSCSTDKIWLGTESGLTCFDLNTHHYIPCLIKEEGFSHILTSEINGVTINPEGNHLWISTPNGTFPFFVQENSLSPLGWHNDEERMLAKHLFDVQYSSSAIWATIGSHLLKLKVEQGKLFVEQRYKVSDLLHCTEHIQHILLNDNHIYIRTRSGCYKAEISNGHISSDRMTYIDFHRTDPEIPPYTDSQLIIDKDGTLWGAYTGGVFEICCPFSDQPEVKKHLRSSDQSNRSMQKISQLLIDSYNNLWVATNSWGVFYRSLHTSMFHNLSQEDFHNQGLNRNEIVAITGADDDNVYLLVEYASLFKYQVKTDKLIPIHLPFAEIGNFYLQDIEMSRDNTHLYIGTNRGVFTYDTLKGTLNKLHGNIGHISLDYLSVADLKEDLHGRLWIASWGNGLFRIENPCTSPSVTLHLSRQSDPALPSDLISCLKLYNHYLYVGSTHGMSRIDFTSIGGIRKLSTYAANERKRGSSLSSDYIASIDCYSDSICWIGTIGGGLNRMLIHSEADNDYTATRYTTKHGLNNNDCEIVMTDIRGNVWIGGNGLCRLDVEKNKIYSYGFADGLQHNIFKIGVSYKSHDGTFYMGGVNGMSCFVPASPIQRTKNHKLIFTDLSINNELIVPGQSYNSDIILDVILDKVKHLALSYKQNNFAINFALLGYGHSSQLAYRYRLVGFQSQWHTLRGDNQEIYYSNLPYGNYTLELQLSTDKGQTWQTQYTRHLSIEINPPLWWSWYAKLLYLILLGIGIYIALQHYAKEQRLKKENEIQKILIKQDEEKYQAKMQFFMNASHELKTPLTLIQLAAEKLISYNTGGKEEKSILHNVKRMLGLIAELVDIRKHDLGITDLHLQRTDMSSLVQQLFDEMTVWAEKKHIKVSYNKTEKPVILDADIDKLTKMILNLFSNAIKYTNEGGCISVDFDQGTLQDICPSFANIHTEGEVGATDPLCILTVKDDGVGISADSIKQIYGRFFQVLGNTETHLGAGIGLAIVKSTVLQHEGEIVVSSQRNVGTEFIVALPIRQQSDEMTAKRDAVDVKLLLENQYDEFDLGKTYEPVIPSAKQENPDLPTLLIVEDNIDLQTALFEHFTNSYNVRIASNGRQGLDLCLEIYPDIIMTDVMMPEMNGIEMCRQIKENLSIAYIPIVMLTAKSNVESQIEGYESGADFYLPKPFSMKLLEVNLKRLLKQREQWSKVSACSTDTISPITEADGDKCANEHDTATDETAGFLSVEDDSDKEQVYDSRQEKELKAMTEQLKAIIEQQMEDPDLSPEKLARTMGISRTKLYRDLKRIDGFSLAYYLRNARLEKAAYLLRHSDLNVSEVMYDVGFINSSHFTKIFKQKYGVTPSDYKKTD